MIPFDILPHLPFITAAIIRFILVITVSLHILLTKRNTSSAIGWIGICILMPAMGTILYLMFGINRVRRLARKLVDNSQLDTSGSNHASQWIHNPQGDLAPLAVMVRKLTDRPLTEHNKITCLHDGDNTYPLMLQAIADAEQSILICSYIFRNDKTGRDFIEKLSQAHKRGVQVRVLVDGIGSGYFLSPVYHRLRRAGVPCSRFMHSLLPWRMPFINLRNHRKILVVDGKIGFMGGLNIADENLVLQHPKEPVSDTHFQLEGPIVRQLAEVIATDWCFSTGEILKGDIYFKEHVADSNIAARIVTAGPDSDLEKIEFTMMQAVTLARKQVRIMTPYFLPGSRVLSELALAALRGVEVDIIIPQHSNHPLMDWACAANIGPALDAGVKVWLVKPPFNHSKLMVVDRKWTFAGSSNMDIRSLRLNFEINFESYDETLAGTVDDFMSKHKHIRLTHHHLDQRHNLIKIRDAAVRLFMPYL